MDINKFFLFFSTVLDTAGRQYDINSKNDEWWLSTSVCTFDERAECYGEQVRAIFFSISLKSLSTS